MADLLKTRSFSVGIIGMGSLGENIAQMIIHRHLFDLNLLSVHGSYRREERRDQLSAKFRFNLTLYNDNVEVVKQSDVLILAVKPGQIKEVCESIANDIDSDTIVISTAAIISIKKLREWLPGSSTVIRCMPNIPCSIGKGVVPYYSDVKDIDDVMKRVFAPNDVIKLESDAQVDTSTIITGCGPAFFAWYAKQINKAGTDNLPANILNEMLIKTMIGTASLLQSKSFDDIIREVASPKGVTETALKTFANEKIDTSIGNALLGAQNRINELIKLL